MIDSIQKPKLRFKEFNDSWDFRNLGEIFHEYSEKNHGELPALMVVQGGGTLKREDSNRNLSYNKDSLSNYKKVDEDDFIVHLRSFEGGLERASCCGIISPAYHIFHGENTDSTFYYSYFRSKKFIDVDLKPHVYGIRDGRSIDIDGMKTIRIPNPKLKEQMAIGKLISSLDNKISAHQKKYINLHHLKQTMLEKMFPKDGADVPEIRFDGFAGEWDKYTLINIATIKARIGWQGLTKSEYLNHGEYQLVTGTDFDDGKINFHNCHYIDEYRYSQDKNIQLKNDDVLVTKDGTIGKVAYIKKLTFPATLNSGVFVIRSYNKDVLNEYLFRLLSTPLLLNYAKDAETGGTIKHLNQNVLERFTVFAPLTIGEQNCICKFFSGLDSKIDYEKMKLIKYLFLKKALLERMFVS